jgi:hypothetical protein
MHHNIELGGLENGDVCGDDGFVGLGDKEYPSIHGSDMLEVILYVSFDHFRPF